MSRITLIEMIHRVYELPGTKEHTAVETFERLLPGGEWTDDDYRKAVAYIDESMPSVEHRNGWTTHELLRCCFCQSQTNVLSRYHLIDAVERATAMHGENLRNWTRMVTGFGSFAELEAACKHNAYVPTFSRNHSLGSLLGEYIERQGYRVFWLT
jgi:hypothetical protein